MDFNYNTKEEDFGQDTLYKIVKKEDYTGVKLEENVSYSTSDSQSKADISNLTVPWKNANSYLIHSQLTGNRSIQDSTAYSIKKWDDKPFIIIKTGKSSTSSTPFRNISSTYPSDSSSKSSRGKRSAKKSVRVSACKNYIGLVCAGIARAILTAPNDSHLSLEIEKLIKDKKMKFTSLDGENVEELTVSLKKYIYNQMCGKTVKKTHSERDFKIRNTYELEKLLFIGKDDKELDCLKKEVTKEILDYFFGSDCYNQWISTGMMNESNRLFFVRNKDEIHKKFLQPIFYKPRFNHYLDADDTN